MSSKARSLLAAFVSISLAACSGFQTASQVPSANAAQSNLPIGTHQARSSMRPNVTYTYVKSSPGTTATAQCPTGDDVIAGGFANVSQTQNTTDSHWANSHTAWTASNPYSVYAYVICAGSGAVNTHYFTAAFSSGLGGGAGCNTGQEVSGGGFSLTSGTIAADYPPSSSGWTVDTYANQGAGTAYAVCTTDSYTYEFTAFGSDETAQCPASDVVVGGGFVENNGPEKSDFVPYLSHYANNHTAWRAAATGNTLIAYAVCTP